MKTLIFKAAAVMAVVCASFAFTTKGQLQVVSCNVAINTCELRAGTFQPGDQLTFERSTFNVAADQKVGCLANCNQTITADPEL